MKTRRIIRFGLPLLLSVAAPACAGRRGRDSTAENTAVTNDIRIEVRNNLSDGGNVTVFIEPALEIRTQLGSLASGETRTFVFTPPELNRVVRLIATSSMGPTIVSRGLTVPRGGNLSWDLRVNSLRVVR